MTVNNLTVLWHFRLGHPSFARMNLLQPHINDITASKIHHCTVCPMAKQHRLPFPISVTETQFPFELIYCDL